MLQNWFSLLQFRLTKWSFFVHSTMRNAAYIHQRLDLILESCQTYPIAAVLILTNGLSSLLSIFNGGFLCKPSFWVTVYCLWTSWDLISFNKLSILNSSWNQSKNHISYSKLSILNSSGNQSINLISFKKLSILNSSWNQQINLISFNKFSILNSSWNQLINLISFNKLSILNSSWNQSINLISFNKVSFLNSSWLKSINKSHIIQQAFHLKLKLKTDQ